MSERRTRVRTFVIGPATEGGAGFEAKLVDGASGETVAEISEKHSGGTSANALFVAPYQKYGHSREAFRSWAERTAELLRGPDTGR